VFFGGYGVFEVFVYYFYHFYCGISKHILCALQCVFKYVFMFSKISCITYF